MPVQLAEMHLTMLEDAFSPFLTGQQVYLFGSRAKGTAKKYSDIDLCLTGDVLNLSQMAELKESLSESDLPYFVDIVQKQQISESFYQAVKSDFILLFG